MHYRSCRRIAIASDSVRQRWFSAYAQYILVQIPARCVIIALMRLKLQNMREAVRVSYFFLPMLLALGGIALSVAMVALDQTVRNARLSGWSWIFAGGGDGARTVLSTMAGSIITVAGIAYSITIAALVLASTQFGPRLLRNFLSDRANQFVLGSFVGTFLFCVLVLRTVRTQSEGGVFVPQIAVTVAILLTIGCLLLLIYFFHHVSITIQAPSVVAGVSRDLHASIERIFPRGVGHGTPRHRPLSVHELPPDLESNALVVHATQYGYLQAIDVERLFTQAVQHSGVVKLGFRPGDFVVQKAPLAWFYPAENWKADEEYVGEITHAAFLIGDGRTPLQDIEYGVNQLVEVACRALSPAINDPFTAMACLDHLGSALTHLLDVTLPSPLRYDNDDQLRMIAERISFAGLVNAAFNMIRQYGRESAAVTIRLLETIAQVAPHADEESEKAVLRLHAEMTRSDCQKFFNERDRLDVQKRFDRAMRLLA